MIITKNGETLNVSKGAFNALFESQGWVKAEAESDPKPRKRKKMNIQPEPKIADLEMEKSSGNNFIGDDIEITPEGKSDVNSADVNPEEEAKVETPISEMSIEQLIEYADEHNIDISGASGKRNILKKIENALKKR